MNASREQAAGALRRVERLLDVLGVAAERLLAEDVLARLERPDRPLDVHACSGARCRRRRRPDPRAAPRTSRTPARCSHVARVLLGPLLVAARDSDQLDLVGGVRAGDHEPVDVRRRDDAEPNSAPRRLRHRPQRGLEDAVSARAREAEEDDLSDVVAGHHPGQHVAAGARIRPPARSRSRRRRGRRSCSGRRARAARGRARA